MVRLGPTGLVKAPDLGLRHSTPQPYPVSDPRRTRQITTAVPAITLPAVPATEEPWFYVLTYGPVTMRALCAQLLGAPHSPAYDAKPVTT